ncbi:hypothetical protein ZHAS_00005595 [Anopheles sinensis]|uniref:Uncharacterized protein n=1 Tax=Anopheles sinensis TaxID=74873 RepID=A0A084VJU7_ANOSI|nr:hypothetical protein ZHAS_00005595 [Anopheles sinensis]
MAESTTTERRQLNRNQDKFDKSSKEKCCPFLEHRNEAKRSAAMLNMHEGVTTARPRVGWFNSRNFCACDNNRLSRPGESTGEKWCHVLRK